ncbi:hypothetical protein BaRGS_00034535 [Batillaria attramentaria]|uniref:Uncharacterized protein n=1 Tax=Batillaria attramentaria TaxID=370345 RepID=A0ABD0JH53_9CAEN
MLGGPIKSSTRSPPYCPPSQSAKYVKAFRGLVQRWVGLVERRPLRKARGYREDDVTKGSLSRGWVDVSGFDHTCNAYLYFSWGSGPDPDLAVFDEIIKPAGKSCPEKPADNVWRHLASCGIS